MRFARKIWFMLILCATLVSACGGEQPTEVSVEQMLTEGVGTLSASIQQTQTALAPTITVTSTATATSTTTPTGTPTIFGLTTTPSPTYPYYTATLGTLGPTFTASPTGTLPTATVKASALAYGCNNLAFIRDVNYPSGTVVESSENFTKIWKVANNGTCNWMYQYSLELLSANYPESGTAKLGKVVTVNDWAELSMNIDAPKNPGTYTSYWRLSDGAGHMFGSTLTASFIVGQPTNTEEPDPPTATPTPTPTP